MKKSRFSEQLSLPKILSGSKIDSAVSGERVIGAWHSSLRVGIDWRS